MANMTRRTAIGASAGAASLVGVAQAADPNSRGYRLSVGHYGELDKVGRR